MQKCWCGNAELGSFSPEYGRCDACGTLVYKEDIPAQKLLVIDDESDFYGKQYWLSHQQDSFGYPDIYQRVRQDLTERNLHWMLTLLKYCRPPGSVMEIGCSHGSFVALLDHAGFDAVGVEMSPWVVDFGRRTFGSSILQGPIEALDFPEASFDAIALMDVLEHLPDPKATMDACLRLLKPDGLLLIQTPEYVRGMDYEEQVKSGSVFLEVLKPVDHLYLFSRESVSRFFRELGVPFIRFEDAIFSHYDMFLAVSRGPLEAVPDEEFDKTLMTDARSRMVLALLDLYRRELAGHAQFRSEIVGLENRLAAAEVDRAARLEVIQRQGDELGRMSGKASEVDGLRAQLAACEEDRAARLNVIEDQGRQLGETALRVREYEDEIRRLRSEFGALAARVEARLGNQIRGLAARLRGGSSNDEGR